MHVRATPNSLLNWYIGLYLSINNMRINDVAREPWNVKCRSFFIFVDFADFFTYIFFFQ